MAAITPQDIVGKYPATPLAADAADFTFQAMELAGDTFPNTGREIIVVRNDDAGAVTLDITGVVDEKNRLGNIESYSIGAGEYATFGPFPVSGWNDASGNLNLTASDVDLKVAVLRFTL